MAKAPRSKKTRDVRAGLVCADAFQRLAELFIGRIGTDVKEGRQDPSTEFGDLVACATNLSLALELYMKALITQLELTVPKDHDLRSLFDTLPQQVKTQIEEVYDKAWRSQWNGRRASITIAKGPYDEPPWSDYSNESKDLGALLQRSRDVFCSWRYIYEFTEPEGSPYQFHQFEYGLLLCACHAVKATAEYLGAVTR